MKNIIQVILFFSLAYSQLVINEIMSSNSSSFFDSNGDTPDWIELYNPTNSQINLLGYGLSDDSENPYKWIFPEVVLPAQEYLLILASGNNEQSNIMHWETVIDLGDSWTYFLGNQEPPNNWMDTEFNDSNWLSGNSGFGYGDGDDNTIVENVMSVFTRKSFYIESVESIEKVIFHVDYDDAFVAYLNGVEVARNNITATPVGIPPYHNQGADAWREAEMYTGGYPEEYELDLSEIDLFPGVNLFAIQVHNFDSNSSDMSLIPFLSLGLNEVPENPTDPPEILNLQTSNLHANFNISSSGETIILTDSLNQIIDLVNEIEIPTDFSYGRQPDGDDNFVFFPNPTPNEPNVTVGFDGFCETPEFSQDGGLYNNSISIELTSNENNYPIYYTLDGSEPDLNSYIFNQQINLYETSVIRASVIHPNCYAPEIATSTYIINHESGLPVISLTTNPENFFDNDYGIYMMGDNADNNFPHFGANFWEDWERPVHIEFYEPDGMLGFKQDAGVKIFGNYSRGWPQKSLAIFARSEYGDNDIDYKIFPNKNIDKFKSLVLRNSGNDWFGSGEWTGSMFRDGLNTSLVENTGLDYQAYRPSVVYINGEYWGIHNIREKVNEDFLAANNNGVDPDELDQLEASGDIIEGDNQEYQELINFVSNNSLSNEENYAYVSNLIDIENFIDYYIIQIFIGNTDWPGNNIKFWKPHIEGSKWRWILYDTDFGFGLFPSWSSNVYHNTLQFALEEFGPGWPNPPWSTLLFRRLIENPSFQNMFINHFCFYLSTRFKPDHIESKIDNIVNNISTEMPNHINKWSGSMSQWYESISAIREFGQGRNANIYTHLSQYFDLYMGTSNVVVSSYPEDGGRIITSNQIIPENPWNATYFNGVNLQIKAIPNPGFTFSHWGCPGTDCETNPNLSVDLSSNEYIVAVFVEEETPSIIQINEFLASNQSINTDEEENFEDWIELYYNVNGTINLNGYSLSDNFNYPNKWIFPDLEISGEGFLLIWADDDDEDGDLHTNFKLSASGEEIGLYNSNGDLLDSISFSNQNPDISYGRINENSDEWQLFDMPSPGDFNSDNIQLGDINADGVINVVDLVMIVNMILGINENSIYADYNQDGLVNIVDVVQLVNTILGNSAIDATTATLVKSEEDLSLLYDGHISAIQMTISHDDDFNLNLNKNALISEYNTDKNITKIFILHPYSETILSTDDNYLIDEIIVMNSSNRIDVIQPYEFNLVQAYPNPFNPTTNIDFSIPNNGLNVSIKIYDINGRVLTTLVNKEFNAGYHNIKWNASNYASGIYFVKMISDSFIKTQKLMLIK